MRRAGTTALLTLLPVLLAAQVDPAPRPGTREVTVAAGAHYRAGGLHRFFLGDTYRDLWTTPIRVPVLDLEAFAGGIRPTKAGGGNQTKNLRFETATGVEYVFRMVDKDKVPVPKGFDHTVVERMAKDQVSASHPAAAIVAAPLLDAARILHVTPILTVMPDDPALGEFRKDFAGRLGTIELYPSKPERAPGFAGAVEIIDSDKLRPLLDSVPGTRVDARAYLAARLMDMLLNDWDRHPGQWKWARFSSDRDAPWTPIPRDRDKPFISYGGIVAIAGKASPNLLVFRASYPSVRGLTWNSIEFDRRLLGELERPVFDSVARSLAALVTDPKIDAAVSRMPDEYLAGAPELARKLKSRRDALPAQAARFYDELAEAADIHATEAADRAAVRLNPDRSVLVELFGPGGRIRFRRTFHPVETREIRIYLHGGDDSATVTGRGPASIPVRIIGGNGSNRLADSTGAARLYDNGQVTDVEYGPDTLFNRRPWVRYGGEFHPPARDRGGKFSPALGLAANGDLGVVLRAGVTTYSYGFRRRPYAGRTGLLAEYAAGVGLFRVTAALDRRRESSPLHFKALARMSEIEVVNFHGYGNDTPERPEEFFEARQRQWLFQPAVAFSLGSSSDISIGPVLQYATADSLADRFISDARPYGFGDFGQAGLRLGWLHDSRNRTRDSTRGLLLDLSGTWYPGIWDVRTGFGSVSASAGAYLTLPVPLSPVLALRAGGKKVWGEFPFHEAAFIGGRNSLRMVDRERYAGDAALSGSVELRVPVARFPLILPFDVGVFGFADAGRVYVGGNSPGGWHHSTGAGFWVGILNPATSLSVEIGDRRGSTGVQLRTGLSF
ncbi:MAG TPA: BamA/TamA family outer membrane protein [Gemmatimonadales bacterium]